jgi:hypothetical protein
MDDSSRITRKEQAQRNKHRRKAGDAARALARAQQAGDTVREERARTRLLRHKLGTEDHG